MSSLRPDSEPCAAAAVAAPADAAFAAAYASVAASAVVAGAVAASAVASAAVASAVVAVAAAAAAVVVAAAAYASAASALPWPQSILGLNKASHFSQLSEPQLDAYQLGKLRVYLCYLTQHSTQKNKSKMSHRIKGVQQTTARDQRTKPSSKLSRFRSGWWTFFST